MGSRVQMLIDGGCDERKKGTTLDGGDGRAVLYINGQASSGPAERRSHASRHSDATLRQKESRSNPAGGGRGGASVDAASPSPSTYHIDRHFSVPGALAPTGVTAPTGLVLVRREKL
jgi:hypothetical protein